MYTDDKWYCCGADSEGNPKCSTPESEVVDGIPAPNVLQSFLSGTGSSTTSAASASNTASTTSNTATATPSSQAQSKSEEGVSNGAKAGIGAGVGILIAILIVALALFCMRRRRRRNQTGRQHLGYDQDDVGAAPNHVDEMKGSTPVGYRDQSPKGPLFSSEPVELMSSSRQKTSYHELG